MSQNDMSLADAPGATFLADVNSAIQALVSNSSGTSAPSTTYAAQTWYDTTANLKKRRNAANSGWVVEGTLDETFIVSRSTNTSLGVKDRDKVFRATASFTQTFDAVATLGDGWRTDYAVPSGVTTVFDPNSTEQIDGASTLSVTGPAFLTIWCDGSALRTSYTAAGAAPTATNVPNVFLAADVALNNTANYFNICNTGSIGANGQVWLIIAEYLYVNNVGATTFTARIWDGSSTVYVEASKAANTSFNETSTIFAIVTLTGATTFHLSCKDISRTDGNVKTSSASGTANKATYIAAIRLA